MKDEEIVEALTIDGTEKRGSLVKQLSAILEGQNMADSLIALTVLISFVIDSADEKEEALNRVIEGIDKLVHFDEPAYKSGRHME